MCVLTYLPFDEGFILTSNRDENTQRLAAKPPHSYRLNAQNVFFPKDPQSLGTWIATHKQFTLCLLNGASEKHISSPPYKHSRGQIIIDFFGYGSIESFRENYNFADLEPFTLVIVDRYDTQHIHQLRWNGLVLSNEHLDKHQPKIWSSSTLYSPEVIAFRERCFEDLLQHNTPSALTLLEFHKEGGGNDPENRLLMNRNNTLQTISITQIVQTPKAYTISYEDLVTTQKYDYRILQEKVP